jgi:ABC-type sugar transport system permease subunit/ABC-type glycerol-3-phosphate transport system substrate-binding protein
MKPVAVMLALALATLTGGVSSGATNPVVELRLWNIPSKNATFALDVAKRRVFDAFAKAHPEIDMKALVPLKIEGPAAESSEFLAVAGGVAPDVFSLFGRKVGDYRSQGFLLPLNDHLARSAKRRGVPYLGIGAPDSVWELCCDRGRILAVPSGYYSMALGCDEATFARRGLAGRYPKDWDELYEFARHLTVDPAKELNGNPNDGVTYGISLLTGIYAGWHYMQYVWSSGGTVVQSYYPKDGQLHAVSPPPVDYRQFQVRLSNEDDYYRRVAAQESDLRQRGLPTDYSVSDLKWRLETDKSEAMEALFFYRKLAHQPWLRNGDHEFDITPEMFRTRQAVDPVTGDTFNLDDPAIKARLYRGVTAAANIQASGTLFGKWNYAMGIATIGDADAGVMVPFPSRKGQPPAAFIAGGYLGINAAIAAENRPGRRDVQAIRDAAWAYIEFVTGPEAQRITVQTFVEFGQTEYVRPALLVSAGYEDLLERIPIERRQLWENLTRYARVEPYCPGFTHVMTRELGMAIEAVLGDRPDPETGAYHRDLQGVMNVIAGNVNTMILDRIPEAVVRKRARIGWVIFAVMLAGLAFGLRLIVKLAMQAQSKWADTEGFGVGGNPAARRLYAWLFLVPAVGTIAIWNYYPLIKGLMMGFQDFRILGNSSWVGLRNFVEAVSEPKFWRYLGQTVQYVLMAVGLGFYVPILLALLLTEIPRFKVFYRTIYYLPAVTTGLVTLFLWKNLLYNSTSQGILNRIVLWFNVWPGWLAATVKLGVLVAALLAAAGLCLQATRTYTSRRGRWIYAAAGSVVFLLVAGLLVSLYRDGGWGHLAQALTGPFAFKVQSFLRDPNLAMLWVIIPDIWAGAGPGCLIYLAALKGIPEEQYEAADLDGAGLWHKIINVTYPNLKALIVINFVGAVVGGFKASGNIFVMTGGGPEDATMTTGLYIWYNAFMFLNFGLSTAMAWIMGALLIGFTLTQLRILNKLQFRNVAVEAKT